MPSQPAKRHRRSIRLKGYDYAQAGAYSVTICTHSRECLLGDIADGEVRLNRLGEIARDELMHTALVRRNVLLDEFVVMPNHLHGIIIITGEDVGATQRVAPTTTPNHPHGPAPGSIGAIVGQFKSAATKRINALRGTPGLSVWQRNYYEHIIRSEADLNQIREYIANNPLEWELDENNPARASLE